MKKGILLSLLLCSLSGCFMTRRVCKVRILKFDRCDQDMNKGNCGYIMGQVPDHERHPTKKFKKRELIEFDMTPLFDPQK